MEHLKILCGSDAAALKFAGAPGSNLEDAFKGYASTFKNVDAVNDTIMPGAYKSLLGKIAAGAARMPKMFYNHAMFGIPVGKWLDLSEDETGLLATGELTKGIPQSTALKAAMRHGTVDGLSVTIGFSKGDYEIIERADGTRNRVIHSISALPEISICSFPADDPARIDLSTVKSMIDGCESLKDVEAFLRDACGFSKQLATATVSQVNRLSKSKGDPLAYPSDVSEEIRRNFFKIHTD